MSPYKVCRFLSLFQDRDGKTLWLIEVLYSIQRDVLRFIVSKESCMPTTRGPDSRDEKVIYLLAFSRDTVLLGNYDRQTDQPTNRQTDRHEDKSYK